MRWRVVLCHDAVALIVEDQEGRNGIQGEVGLLSALLPGASSCLSKTRRPETLWWPDLPLWMDERECRNE